MKISLIIALLAGALWVAACAAPAGNIGTNNAAPNTNTNVNSAKPTAAAPTKDALFAIEKSAWEAWKNRDNKFWDGYLSDKYIGFGPNGRLDKAAAIKLLNDAKQEVKSYSHSDEQMTPLGSDAALLTFRTAQDYTNDGKPGPKDVWSASVYVRDGDKWKSAYYNEVAVVDPKAPPVKAAATPATETKPAADAKTSDAATEALMAVEKKAWDAWKARDAKGIDGLLTKDLVMIDPSGRYDYAGTMKSWFESKCEVKSYSLTDPASTSFTKDMSILTFNATSSGTCDGQPLGKYTNTSVYLKEGENWKMAFSFLSPVL